MLVIVSGMPRSASTLQSNIIKILLTETNTGIQAAWMKNWQENIDLLDQQLHSDKFYSYKTHWLTDSTLKLASTSPENVYITTSYRDIRDIASSAMRKFNYSFSKSRSRIKKALLNLDRIEASNLNHMSQPYESLRFDLGNSIDEVSSFLGINCGQKLKSYIYDELNIEQAYLQSRKRSIPFEGIRRKLSFAFNLPVKFADSKYRLHPEHVSEEKGISGIWKNYLTQEQTDLLVKDHYHWMLKKNYIDE